MIDEIDAVHYVRSHPQMFVKRTPPSAREIAAVLADALQSTGTPGVTTREKNDWWIVAANEDWVRATGRPLHDLFNQIVPWPHAGRNSMRPEILVTAFGDEAITAAGTDRWDILGKTAPNAEIWSEVVNAAASGRAVAIKCATAP